MSSSAPAIMSTTADDVRRRGLRRMRTVAVSLLALAAVVYILTLDRGGGWGYLHAASEAAMVGAIADWFAVAALFRHPLGLPIPHTASYPPARTPSPAASRSSSPTTSCPDLSSGTRCCGRCLQSGSSWISCLEHAAASSTRQRSRTGLGRVRDEDVEAFIGHELSRLADEPLSAIAGQLLGDIVEEGAHHGLADLAVNEAHAWWSATRRPSATSLDPARGGRRSGWTTRSSVACTTKRSPGSRTSATARTTTLGSHSTTSCARPPRPPARRRHDGPRGAAQGQAARPAAGHGDRHRAVASIEQGHPGEPRGSREHTAVLAEHRLVELGGARPRRGAGGALERYTADLAVFVVERYGTEITTVITDTIEAWDGGEAACRIELHVGRTSSSSGSTERSSGPGRTAHPRPYQLT